MTLHYRKLLIASVVFPLVVVALLVISLPSLMQARSSSAFGKLRANVKSLEMHATLIEAANHDESLTQHIDHLHETIENQQDALVDLREVILSETETAGGPGWIAMISAIIGIVGTISSIVLSWRQDMRQAGVAESRSTPNAASIEPTAQAA